MTIFTIGSDQSAGLSINLSGSAWIVKAGIAITDDGAAIDASASSGGNAYEIEGSLVAFSGYNAGIGLILNNAGATSSGTNQVRIGASGSILGGFSAIESAGGYVSINNAGMISANGSAVALINHHNSIVNSGSILSSLSFGVSLGGDWNTLENVGRISGHAGAVRIDGHQNSVLNSGWITSADLSGTTAAVQVVAQSFETNTISNAGHIEGGDFAISGDAGDEIVNNSGTISGSLSLYGGEDIVNNIGGTILGSVILGDGGDIYRGLNGFVSGSVNGGDGTDFYYISDNATLLVEDEGAGVDSVVANTNWRLGANFEILTLSGTQDWFAIGNGLDNNINGNAGGNVIKGGAGDDWLNGLDGADGIIGGSGHDVAFYYDSDAGIRIDLAKGTGRGGHAEGDRLSGIEEVSASRFSDTLIGDRFDNAFVGRDGKDRLYGAGGGDTLTSSHDQDLLDGGSGVDTVEFVYSPTAVKADLWAGTVRYGATTGEKLTSIENIVGGDLGDVFFGSAGANHLSGGAGADRLGGRSGNDVLTGGNDADRFIFQAGTDKDRITDFADGVDIIDLSSYRQIASFKDLAGRIVQDGSDTVITLLRGDQIVVEGLSAANLTNADFAF